MLKGLLFDMDGVLLDTETICQKTWAIAAEEMNLSNINETFLQCLGTTKIETTEETVAPEAVAEEIATESTEDKE